MNMNGSKTDGIFIGIDFGDIERSMQSRERLKQRAVEKQEQSPMREDPNFQANRLINTLQEKGTILDMVV
jgi:hypothetical protein